MKKEVRVIVDDVIERMRNAKKIGEQHKEQIVDVEFDLEEEIDLITQLLEESKKR